jgi:Helix-turn-helix domain
VGYPGRKIHDILPQFAGTNGSRPTAEQRAELLAFVAKEYPAGRSLRELAELTGRTQTAIRRALDELGVPRRGPGAPAINAE